MPVIVLVVVFVEVEFNVVVFVVVELASEVVELVVRVSFVVVVLV